MKRLLLLLLLLLLFLIGCGPNPEYEALRQQAQQRLDVTNEQAQPGPAPTSVWSAAQPAQAAPVPTSVPTTLKLQQPTTFYYAPNPERNDQTYGVVGSGVEIVAIAKYGTEWVQLEVQDHGELWTRSEHVSYIDTTHLMSYDEGE